MSHHILELFSSEDDDPGPRSPGVLPGTSVSTGRGQGGAGRIETGRRCGSDACGSLHISVTCQSSQTFASLESWLVSSLMDLAQRAGVRRGQLSVAVVDDAQMIELHEQYLQTAKTTDVLTFDLRDVGHTQADEVDGELVICLDEAQRQAAVRGHTFRLELLLYAVHGLLHLLGFDDHDPEDARKMHQEEDRLLRAGGFGVVYASGKMRGQDAGGDWA